MPDRLLPERDLAFILYDVLEADGLLTHDRFQGHDRAACDAVLATAERIAWEMFRNHYRLSDRRQPELTDGRVVLPAEIGEGVRAFHDAGFASAHHDAALGGMQLPWVFVQAAFAYFQTANIATAAYPFLTIAAGNLIAAHGSQRQIETYLPPMMSGRFFGTMALSEPQAGSSLSLIRTRAQPLGDGRYRITGSKMWTSGGEHDMADTIVHMLLARIDGAPDGVKGLSLFIVPRDRVGPDGALNGSNDVTLIGLNHKMGYRGTVNTALYFGENGGCIGELVGEENQGLAYMFHMMNEARIGVGMGAVALACAGYVESLRYARDRRQGRAVDPADGRRLDNAPIIAHADVRRMLLMQKAVAEGGLCLALYCARLVDEKRIAASDDDALRAHRLLDLLTPVLKAWFSDAALRANDAAIQILGGYGYTADFPVEQFWRDNRLNPIHEGTNGIQALDLIGRKIALDGGAALDALGEEIAAVIAAAPDLLAKEAEALGVAWDMLRAVAGTVNDRRQSPSGQGDLDNADAMMEAMGRVVLGFVWLKMASRAAALPQDGFAAGKIQTCRYVMARELPPVFAALDRLAAGEGSVSAMMPDWF